MDDSNAVVIGNAQKVIGEITEAGTAYNPSENRYKIVNLQLQHDAAELAEADVVTQYGLFDPFRQRRAIAFAPIDGTCMGAKGIFNGSGTTAAAQKSLMAQFRKLEGIRKVPKIKVPVPGGPINISVSQQEFDSKLINFLAIIVTLENNAKYNPNEVEYKTVTLRAMYNDAVSKNNLAKNAAGPYHTALNLRDKLLYQDVFGICDTYNHGVKEYSKGALRNNKPAYNRIKKIPFKKRPYADTPV